MTPFDTSLRSPLLSVLCLTYNHEAYIARALESFLAQETDFEIEIVLADDCSADHTLEIVEQSRQRAGERLRVLTTPINLGVTRNFRRAIQACRGKYIAFCEGDDFWRGTSKLQKQVNILESNPDVVITYHNATVIGADGRESGLQLPSAFQCDASSSVLITTRPIPTLTSCFRNVLSEIPAELDHAPVLDLCLWSLLGHYGKGKFLTDIEHAGYQIHANGIFSSQTEGNRHLMAAQSLLCLARYYARQGRPDLSNALLLNAHRLAGVPMGLKSSLQLQRLVLTQVAIRAKQLVREQIFRVKRSLISS